MGAAGNQSRQQRHTNVGGSGAGSADRAASSGHDGHRKWRGKRRPAVCLDGVVIDGRGRSGAGCRRKGPKRRKFGEI
uniref:Uncharacterized protein n=1 Tax=Romanomermis culicivorax TaxID=13658 RepID=A0A915JKD0_ROMCU